MLEEVVCDRGKHTAYGRRPGQPSSSSLARRVCVQSPTSSSCIRMPLFYVVLRLAYVSLWVQVLLEYVATDFLNFAKAPGPFGDRGGTPLMSSRG